MWCTLQGNKLFQAVRQFLHVITAEIKIYVNMYSVVNLCTNMCSFICLLCLHFFHIDGN